MLVVDIMLRALQRDAGVCARAFADDIGAVTGDLYSSQHIIYNLFAEFKLISGLGINFAKTVFIPFWVGDIINIAAKFKNKAPTGVKLSSSIMANI